MKSFATALLIAGLSASTANAAVVVNVSDNESTAPTFGANDAGNLTTGSEFGLDAGEVFGQTFTLAQAGVLDSIYIAYNDFVDGNAIDLEISINGTVVIPSVSLSGNNFSGSASDGATPVYWMKFKFSGDPIALNAGLNTFSFDASNEVSSGFAFTPLFANNLNPYAGGTATGVPANNATSGDDLGFAVTLVPEPSSLALLGLGGLLIARRRRA